MAEQEKASKNGDSNQAAASKSGKLDLAKKSESADSSDNGHGESGLSLASSEAKGEIQVGSFAIAGLRPIAPSHLEVFATILNGRPIAASHLQVMEYAGNRPIFASNIAVRDDLTLPGGRPILISDPKLMQASTLPGGRPIASNQTDDGETLMGFID
ncbi:MAG: hypothetical protein Kow00121_38360 [Elainellaceae cyanobacterium]